MLRVSIFHMDEHLGQKWESISMFIVDAENLERFIRSKAPGDYKIREIVAFDYDPSKSQEPATPEEPQ